jgi:hypothetical protein
MREIEFARKTVMLAAVIAALAAPAARAAQLGIATSPGAPAAGQPFAILVSLDTQGDAINAVEGSVALPRGIEVRSVSAGGSGLSLWPQPPAYAPGAGAVEFAGGAPGGVPAGSRITLFTIEAVAADPGTYAPARASVRAYRNDGAGTELAVSAAKEAILVGKDDAPAPAKAADAAGPSFVYADIGRDPALFGGRAFAAFFAEDDASGVAYYEVREGFFSPYRRAERYYVLADQSLRSPVWVRAVDADGNATTERLAATGPAARPSYLAGGILLIGIAWLLLRAFRRRQ